MIFKIISQHIEIIYNPYLLFQAYGKDIRLFIMPSMPLANM